MQTDKGLTHIQLTNGGICIKGNIIHEGAQNNWIIITKLDEIQQVQAY